MYQQGLEKCGKDAGLESGLAECQRAAEERKNPFAQLFGPDMWTKLALNPTTRALIEKPSVRQKLTMLQRNPQLIQAFMQDREVAPAIGVLLGLPFDAFAGGAGGGAGGADDMEAEAQPPAHGAPPRREPEAPKPEPARAPEPELSEEEKAARARKEEAGRLKAAGNDLFAQKQFQEALDLYTKVRAAGLARARAGTHARAAAGHGARSDRRHASLEPGRRILLAGRLRQVLGREQGGGAGVCVYVCVVGHRVVVQCPHACCALAGWAGEHG